MCFVVANVSSSSFESVVVVVVVVVVFIVFETGVAVVLLLPRRRAFSAVAKYHAIVLEWVISYVGAEMKLVVVAVILVVVLVVCVVFVAGVAVVLLVPGRGNALLLGRGKAPRHHSGMGHVVRRCGIIGISSE